MEGFHNVVHGFEIIQMVRVNVQDHRYRRMELQEGVHILTGFHHHGFAVPNAGVGPQHGQLSPNNGAGVHAALDEDFREHGGGGGFAMGAGDRHGALEFPGQQPQHHRALQGGDPLFPGSHQLGVVLLARRRVNHALRIANIFRPMAHGHRDSIASNSLQGIGFVDVRAGQLIALVVQNFRHWAHARTANAYKVQFPHMVQNICIHYKSSPYTG